MSKYSIHTSTHTDSNGNTYYAVNLYKEVTEEELVSVGFVRDKKAMDDLVIELKNKFNIP